MSEMMVRAITGAVYVVLTVVALLAGSFTTALLFLPVCLAAADEFHRLHWAGAAAPIPRVWSALMAGTLFLAIAFFQRFGVPAAEGALALGVLLFTANLAIALPDGPATTARALPGGALTMLYVAAPFALLPHFFLFGSSGNGYEAALGLFILLWVNDTGAYLCGRAIGKRPLMPAISPKKTIEGLAGGTLLTLAAAYGIGMLWPVLATKHWLIGGLIISAAGTIGDLLESAMKRHAGVKDSGALLPGHGGILDRFDGFLLAAPAFFAYLLLVH